MVVTNQFIFIIEMWLLDDIFVQPFLFSLPLFFFTTYFVDNVFIEVVLPFWHRHEFKHNHEEWINSVKPVLGPALASQVHETLETADIEIEKYKSIRNEMRLALNSLLKVIYLCFNNLWMFHLKVIWHFMFCLGWWSSGDSNHCWSSSKTWWEGDLIWRFPKPCI